MEKLPNEIKEKICEYMDWKTVQTMRSVSSEWCTMVDRQRKRPLARRPFKEITIDGDLLLTFTFKPDVHSDNRPKTAREYLDRKRPRKVKPVNSVVKFPMTNEERSAVFLCNALRHTKTRKLFLRNLSDRGLERILAILRFCLTDSPIIKFEVCNFSHVDRDFIQWFFQYRTGKIAELHLRSNTNLGYLCSPMEFSQLVGNLSGQITKYW